MAEALILFDGTCNLCNASVNFIIDRDPHREFRFASLQSRLGKDMAARAGLKPDELETLVLVDAGIFYTRSAAALRIVSRLAAPWSMLYVLVAVPRPLRDALYGWVARNRYRWFGQTECCRIPTPDIRDRFLEW